MDGTELAKIDGASPLGRRYYGGAVRDAAAGGLKWTINTNQGSGTFQVDAATNAISDPRRFLPYGEPRSTTPSGWIGTKGYVGGNQDGTGLTHLGAREYDPTAGRFISMDPMMDMGDPQQWNPYAYANNSPVTGSDASGLMTKVDGGGGFGGGAPAPKKKANPFKQVLTGAFKSWRKMNDAPVEMLVGTFNFASSQATAAWNGEQSWGDAFMNWEAFSSKASLEILASPVTVAVEAWDESVATYHAGKAAIGKASANTASPRRPTSPQTVMTVAGGAGALSKLPKMPKLRRSPSNRAQLVSLRMIRSSVR
jgi:RHS repeat-associated protein